MRAAVLGGGSWGTALTILLARNGHDVCLVARDEQELAGLRDTRQNVRYLPGFEIPEPTRFAHIDDDLGQADITVVAVPSGAVREVVSRIKGEHPLVVLASKGLEDGTAKRMSEVASEALPNAATGAISGPNLAKEIVRGIPTAAVAASADSATAERIRAAFMCRTFRVYVSQDVVGVELAGALKNVLAIGAGMADGLGFGDNTKGALLARGLHEMTSLGLVMGAHVETFMGVAGVGDLFATAVSKLSRNYRVGLALGEGRSLEAALASVDQVAEGVTTSACAQILARRHNVPTPVFDAIESVLHGQAEPMAAVAALMDRTARCEGFLPQG